MIPYLGFLISFGTLSAISGPAGPSEMLVRIKHSTKEEIARLIYHYAQKEVSIDDVLTFYVLLDHKEPIDASGGLAAKIQVRDIAFVCIEEITGESLLPLKDKVFPVKAILLYRSTEDGITVRFPIPSLSDDDFEKVKTIVNDWIARSTIEK